MAGLDPLTATELYARVRDLNKKEDITIIMVTHDLPSALANASHVLHLGKEPLFFGDVRRYLESPIGRRFSGGEGEVRNG